MTIPIVGIDPGDAHTGIIARRGPRLLYAAIVDHDDTIADYLAEIDATITKAVAMLSRDQLTTDGTIIAPLIAVEDLNPPNPHLGLINVSGLIGTAIVLGAVLALHPAAIVVAPGGHGSAPLATYPAALIGPRETSGTGKRRHARSAFDIAAVAATLHAITVR